MGLWYSTPRSSNWAWQPSQPSGWPFTFFGPTRSYYEPYSAKYMNTPRYIDTPKMYEMPSILPSTKTVSDIVPSTESSFIPNVSSVVPNIKAPFMSGE